MLELDSLMYLHQLYSTIQKFGHTFSFNVFVDHTNVTFATASIGKIEHICFKQSLFKPI